MTKQQHDRQQQQQQRQRHPRPKRSPYSPRAARKSLGGEHLHYFPYPLTLQPDPKDNIKLGGKESSECCQEPSECAGGGHHQGRRNLAQEVSIVVKAGASLAYLAGFGALPYRGTKNYSSTWMGQRWIEGGTGTQAPMNEFVNEGQDDFCPMVGASANARFSRPHQGS